MASVNGQGPLDWFPRWDGECVAIVAGGFSVRDANLAALRDRIHVIVVNESYRLCPWADVLYACEASWWNMRQHDTAKFHGIKIGFEVPMFSIKQNVNRITIRKNKSNIHDPWVHEFLFDTPGEIGSGQNSGFQAINLAAQFGATGIALIGFDMQIIRQKHWHGDHPSPLRNPDYDRFMIWREKLDGAAHRLAERGIDVVNCSMQSTLRSFPRMPIEKMLERWSL